MENILAQISEALVKGKAPLVRELVQSCLDRGIEPKLILEDGLIVGMDVIGKGFKKDEIYLPEVMVAARAMNAGLEVLGPALSEKRVEPRGKVVVGTVRGDLHDVGKNLVSMMFRGAGFEVLDLGIDVPEERFVEAIREDGPEVVCISALLTLTLPTVGSTIQAIEGAGLRDEVVIMVGGAPVTPRFAESVGADGYADDAASAVDKAVELMDSRK